MGWKPMPRSCRVGLAPPGTRAQRKWRGSESGNTPNLRYLRYNRREKKETQEKTRREEGASRNFEKWKLGLLFFLEIRFPLGHVTRPALYRANDGQRRNGKRISEKKTGPDRDEAPGFQVSPTSMFQNSRLAGRERTP